MFTSFQLGKNCRHRLVAIFTMCGGMLFICATAVAQPQVPEPAPGTTERIRLDADITRYLSSIEGDDVATRMHGFNGLLNLRIPPSMGVPIFTKLVERFSHGDSTSLRSAAYGLGRYGQAARPAVPMLIARAAEAKATETDVPKCSRNPPGPVPDRSAAPAHAAAAAGPRGADS